MTNWKHDHLGGFVMKEANPSSFVNLGVKILSNERREFLSDDSRHRAYEMLDEQ